MKSRSESESQELRFRLALFAGLSGLAFAWRQKEWRSLAFAFEVDSTGEKFLWSSRDGVSIAVDSSPRPLLGFRDYEAFLRFADHGQISFRLKRPFWNELPALRFLVGAARLQNHMRGKNRRALRRSDSLLMHGQASLWTAIKALTLYPDCVRGELRAFSGRCLGFFTAGSPEFSLVGVEVLPDGRVSLIEAETLENRDLSARVVFKDEDSLYDAVHHEFPSLQMVGEGRVEVSGLVPFADLIDATLGEMDFLLNPR
ncbi:MAG: hypothetical protein AAF212_06830 [Verrucomicrobiota bacterium]